MEEKESSPEKSSRPHWQEGSLVEGNDITQFLYQVFSGMKQMVLVFDATSGQVVYANQSACQFYGYTPEEFTGLTLDEIFPNIDLASMPESGLARNRLKCGTLRDVEFFLSEVTVNSNNYHVLMVSDMAYHSDHFSAKFRETFSLYKDVLVGFFSFDDEFRIQTCNRSLSQITGFSETELIGKSFLTLLSPQYHQTLIATILEAGQSRLEAEGIRKNGQRYPALIQFRKGDDTEPKINYAALRDITEMKRAEEKLSLTNDTFIGIFNTLTEAIYILDENNVFIDVNDGAVRMYGYPKSELVGKTPADVSAPGYNDIEAVAEASKRVMQTGISEQFEFWGVRKNGEIFPKDVILNKGKYFGKDCIVVTARDITERKQLEKKLQKAKEAAEESEQLKTAFLQNMSHEIRTPLNAILGFTQMLGKIRYDDNRTHSFVSIIENSTHQLLSIVGDILTVSSLETGQERVHNDEVNLNTLLFEIFAIFHEKAQTKNLALYMKQGLTDEFSTIVADKTKLNQILSNLLSNAIKFTNQGYIEFGYQLTKEKIPSLQFYVKDTGIGISEEWHEVIFDRFRQVDDSEFRKFGGNGLGLSIAKGFVELMGGKIWVESASGKGATFYFTLPYVPAGVAVQKKDGMIKPQTGANHSLVLIAEDEEVNLLYIEELLNLWGYPTIHAKDGKEAVEMVENNRDIGLVLMDIKMPEMDGYTAAKIIKEKHPDLPIVAQTAYALEHEVRHYSDIFDEYLTKPLVQSKLQEVVEKWLKK